MELNGIEKYVFFKVFFKAKIKHVTNPKHFYLVLQPKPDVFVSNNSQVTLFARLLPRVFDC